MLTTRPNKSNQVSENSSGVPVESSPLLLKVRALNEFAETSAKKQENATI